MALPDRIFPVCDLLLGAAYADKRFEDRERDEVKALLADLTGGKLSDELADRIAKFDPESFDLTTTAIEFHDDPEDDRRKLLFLVSAIHEADEEIDLAEDDYLRELAKALALPDSALKGLTVEVEVEELRADLAKVRKPPPPPPKKKS